MKLIINTIWTVVILVMMNNGVAQQNQDTDNHESVWFSTSTSALLNRSSTELATGHISRGIRLAQKALQNELVISDQLIANHNLCIGYLIKGKAEAAKLYCGLATKIAQHSYSIVRVRGAYFLSAKKVNRNVQIANPLLQTVLSNIELHNSHIRVSLINK